MIFFKRMNDKAIFPKRNHSDDAGIDFFSCEEVNIPPRSRALVDTGISWMPSEDEVVYLQLQGTSGNAWKKGVDLFAGVIDQSYRGNIKAVLFNTTDEVVSIGIGDKVCQGIVHVVPQYEIREIFNDLNETARGDKGLGHGSSGMIGETKQ